MDVYDAVVIGAGPAGSEFAFRMARRGFKVLVLEKDKLDREKPCGGGIPVQEKVEFGRLPAGIIERTIDKARMISPENEVLEISSPKRTLTGSIVKRRVYDNYLQRRAEEAGAILLPETEAVGIIQKNGLAEIRIVDKRNKGKERKETTIRARLVADASGYPCRIDGIRRPVADKDVIVTHHVWIRLGKKQIDRRIGNSIEMYCGKDIIPRCYAWIFPKKDVVSVGLGTTKDLLKSRKISLKKVLHRFIRSHPIGSEKLKGGKIISSGGGQIPLAMLARLYSKNIIFLGDAGGFANPLHAGGIYQARKSALIAAKHCSDFLKAKSPAARSRALEGFDREARGHFHDENGRWDIKLRNLFWDDGILNTLIREAKRNKRVEDAIGTILSMREPHEKAYKTLESEMIDMIHSSATEKVEPYKRIVGRELQLFKDGCEADRFARHSFFGDAKRLRVSLVLLSCDIFRGNLKKAAKLAPVYELLHTASLVHDDIMDGAKTRRGRRTLHSIYGVNNAIVAGDYMIGRTYSVLSKGLEGLQERQKTRILGIIGDSTSRCCNGQIMDLRLAKERKYGSIGDYLKMAELKTGSMIEGAMSKGAVIAGADGKDAGRIAMIGRNMGIAFQIIDDSMDLLGNNRSKSLQNDIRQGKITPMLVHALKNSDEKQRRFLLGSAGKDLSRKNLEKIKGIYRKTGAIEYAQRLSGDYAAKAKSDIEGLKRSRKLNRKALGILEEVVDVLGYWGMMAD